MRLAYRELFDVFTAADTEASPPDWVLVTVGIAGLVTPLGAGAAITEGVIYNPLPTHRGRCEYTEHLPTGPDRRLLVSQDSTRQYLVVNVRQGSRHLRGAEPEMVLSLHEVVPKHLNLRWT